MSAAHLVHASMLTLSVSATTLIDSLRGRLTPEACDARLDRWARGLVARAHIQLEVSGLEHYARGEAFVVMSNHQSLYDIPVLYRVFPGRLRMVAKTELFRIPIWAQAMRRAGFVELDRADRERARQSLDRAREAIALGTSIWIAPEGTRSPSGELGAFKSGGFHLALAAQARILPVSIDGTRHVLPAHGAEVREGVQVRVRLHAPVTPEAFGAVGPELIECVRRSVASGLPAA